MYVVKTKGSFVYGKSNRRICIYNYFLDKNKNYINAYESIKELPNLVKENEWLKEVDSCLLRSSIFNLEDSFKKIKYKKVVVS